MNNLDKITYSYLQDLKSAGYSDAKDIYNDLYKWSATVTINDGASSVKYYARTVVSATLSGGTPGETIEVRYVITYPNGDVEYEDWTESGQGKLTGFSWPSGCMKSLYKDATLKVKVVDRAGNTLGSSSITVKCR